MGIFQAVGLGAKMGIEECQHQFRMSRWNCTTFQNSSSIFGGIISVSTYVPLFYDLGIRHFKIIFELILLFSVAESRESAYVHAVTSAGVAFSITKACSKGILTECSCDNRQKMRKSKKNWQWGGCSEVILPSFKLNYRFNL